MKGMLKMAGKNTSEPAINVQPFNPKLTTTDWNAEWMALQQARRKADDPSYWDSRSHTFPTSTEPSAYARRFIELADIQPRETVFDMGCGTGALAVPLGLAGHKVVAADFSRGMLDALMETAFCLGVNEHVHPMLLAWDDDWTTAGVPVCDVALASRSIATGDMQAALAKLDEHARRRVCITLTTGLSPRVDPVLLDAIGREQPRYPDCVFAFNILWGMGVHPELSYIDSSRQSRFGSFDEAIDKTCDAMGATDEERERLIAYSRQHLHQVHDADGGTCWEYDHTRVTPWAFFAWNK